MAAGGLELPTTVRNAEAVAQAQRLSVLEP
jgi:hypothetical protein